MLTPLKAQDQLKLTKLVFSLCCRSTFDVSEGDSNPNVKQPDSNLSESESKFGEKHFEVDHSFLFLVWDYYSGMLLLMGRVVDPSQLIN